MRPPDNLCAPASLKAPTCPQAVTGPLTKLPNCSVGQHMAGSQAAYKGQGRSGQVSTTRPAMTGIHCVSKSSLTPACMCRSDRPSSAAPIPCCPCHRNTPGQQPWCCTEGRQDAAVAQQRGVALNPAKKVLRELHQWRFSGPAAPGPACWIVLDASNSSSCALPVLCSGPARAAQLHPDSRRRPPAVRQAAAMHGQPCLLRPAGHFVGYSTGRERFRRARTHQRQAKTKMAVRVVGPARVLRPAAPSLRDEKRGIAPRN